MNDIHIPPAVLERGAEYLYQTDDIGGFWPDASDLTKAIYRDHARAAFLAMIAAWEGMKLTPWWEFTTHKRRVDLVLPLPEKVDG